MATGLLDLDPTLCRMRQDRLRAAMAKHGFDAALLSNPKSLIYFLNLRLPAEFSGFAYLPISGLAQLLTPTQHDRVACDHIQLINIRDQGGPRNDRHELVSGALTHFLNSLEPVKSLGIEALSLSFAAAQSIQQVWPSTQLTNCTPLLRCLRRCKDSDELQLLRSSIRAIEAGYAALPEILRSSRTEIEVHSRMEAAAAQASGTSVWLEGDFASGERGVSIGGPPIDAPLRPGDFHIFDVFPSIYGYRADLCRTAVHGTPTPAQTGLWQVVRDALVEAESSIRPGLACRELHQLVADRLQTHPRAGKSYWHHTGHGIGLDPHESPRITEASEDIFEVGDVFTLEPGLYLPELGGGVRLEDNYIVTAEGAMKISQFPLDLIVPA